MKCTIFVVTYAWLVHYFCTDAYLHRWLNIYGISYQFTALPYIQIPHTSLSLVHKTLTSKSLTAVAFLTTTDDIFNHSPEHVIWALITCKLRWMTFSFKRDFPYKYIAYDVWSHIHHGTQSGKMQMCTKFTKIINRHDKFNDFWNHICGKKNNHITYTKLIAFAFAYFDDQSVLPWMAGLFEEVRLL